MSNKALYNHLIKAHDRDCHPRGGSHKNDKELMRNSRLAMAHHKLIHEVRPSIGPDHNHEGLLC
jgi:hypothetical protein